MLERVTNMSAQERFKRLEQRYIRGRRLYKGGLKTEASKKLHYKSLMVLDFNNLFHDLITGRSQGAITHSKH
jgi:hypothetical protein